MNLEQPRQGGGGAADRLEDVELFFQPDLVGLLFTSLADQVAQQGDLTVESPGIKRGVVGQGNRIGNGFAFLAWHKTPELEYMF